MRTITHYFAQAGYATKAKNKLEQDFQEYLESLNGLLSDACNVNNLLDSIIDKAIELSEKYNRCKPLKIQFYETDDQDSFAISGFPCMQFYLLYAYYESN